MRKAFGKVKLTLKKVKVALSLFGFALYIAASIIVSAIQAMPRVVREVSSDESESTSSD